MKKSALYSAAWLVAFTACNGTSPASAPPAPNEGTAGLAAPSGATSGGGGAAGTTPAPGSAGNGGRSGDSSVPSSADDDAGSPRPGDAGVSPDASDGSTDGQAPPSTASDAAPDAPSSGDGAVPPDEPPVPSCPAQALAPGDSMASLELAGLEREFLIHVPRGYDNTKPVPLVLNFHGATSNAEQQRSLFSLMDSTADAKGFIVVYPQGIGASWNAGACCGDAVTREIDDVGFARALVEYMSDHACIDPTRVYATGFSNGGRMSYRLGCEAADVFAAIAPVAGTKSFPDLDNSPGCMPSRPLSLIDFMGSADMRIAAQPGQIKEWVAFNGCTDAQPKESYRQGAHFCTTYSECRAGTEVTYCVVEGGGHCWPGSTPCPLGSTSSANELSANELMWKLFERSSL